MVKRVSKGLWIAGGVVCVTCACVGLVLPVLPTTPFLLLAAFLFAKGSDSALNWLLNNRLFGEYIRNYREGRGMLLRDKLISIGLLWVTILFSCGFLVENLYVRLGLLVIASGVTFHLARVRTHRPTRASKTSAITNPD